ncbi:beta-defensin 108B [Lontra canadensis]|uniref:beta-defensin 108B n=1 Tax=Lontra canadensis TaxID=76717 RepID=UPI0013F2E2DD|nr:beta-defensin 108B [Lontra canadensis]
MRYGRALLAQTDRHTPPPQTAADGSARCLSEMRPSLVPPAGRPAALLVAALFFVSRVLPAGGRFKEVCERPNGSCQEFCIESEHQAGRCLNGQSCCLPMGNEPVIEPTTPKE